LLRRSGTDMPERGAEELALRLRKAQLDHSRREQFLSALLAAPATGATRVAK